MIDARLPKPARRGPSRNARRHDQFGKTLKTCAALRQTSRQQTHLASLGRTAIFRVHASEACFVGNPSLEGVCRACRGCLCADEKTALKEPTLRPVDQNRLLTADGMTCPVSARTIAISRGGLNRMASSAALARPAGRPINLKGRGQPCGLIPFRRRIGTKGPNIDPASFESGRALVHRHLRTEYPQPACRLRRFISFR
jgi:hypothetical protein